MIVIEILVFVLAYLTIGALFAAVLDKMTDWTEESTCMLCGICWPIGVPVAIIAIVYMVLYDFCSDILSKR